ncbi:MAG: DUF448 domain-containing protein [Alphaproteobacteria bacterium]|nr:DUF448 domain-containing protein [Alphaproteobacteria bacterium]
MRTLPNERLRPADSDGGPERKCILSGDKAPREALLRLAIAPDGTVLPDVHARAPGRGAWIGVSRADLERALADGKLKSAIARAFRGVPLSIPANLPYLVETSLLRAVTERLGLEMRAGNLLAGSDRIAEQARAGRVHWLGHASDAGEDGCRKLEQAWRVGSEAEGSGLQGERLALDRATLSVALGRNNVVHMALTQAAAAERVSSLIARLQRFQGQAKADADTSGTLAGDDVSLPEPVAMKQLRPVRAQTN